MPPPPGSAPEIRLLIVFPHTRTLTNSMESGTLCKNFTVDSLDSKPNALIVLCNVHIAQIRTRIRKGETILSRLLGVQ